MTSACHGTARVNDTAGLWAAVDGSGVGLPCEVRLRSGRYDLRQALHVSRAVNLSAEAEGEAVLHADGTDRVVFVEFAEVVISGLVLAGGSASGQHDAQGGGLYNRGGNVTLINSTVANSTAITSSTSYRVRLAHTRRTRRFHRRPPRHAPLHTPPRAPRRSPHALATLCAAV